MISASIVTFHTRHSDLIRLIDCVMKSPVDKLFIIDNSSNDELRELVKDNKRIRYIHSLNLGYGSGHNIAIKNALEEGADYHAILNPDIYWQDNVIEELSTYMNSHHECGLTMPRVLYPNGEMQYLCKLLPTPIDLILRRFIPIKSWQNRHDYWYEMHWTGYDKIMEIPILSGCFMLLRCDTVKKQEVLIKDFLCMLRMLIYVEESVKFLQQYIILGLAYFTNTRKDHMVTRKCLKCIYHQL